MGAYVALHLLTLIYLRGHHTSASPIATLLVAFGTLSARVNMVLHPGNPGPDPVTYNQPPNNIQRTWGGDRQGQQDAAQ